jgi:hypothetical protein
VLESAFIVHTPARTLTFEMLLQTMLASCCIDRHQDEWYVEFMERFQRLEDEALRMKRPAKDSRLPKAQPSAKYSEDDVRRAEMAIQQSLKEEEEEFKEEVKKKSMGKKKNAKTHGDNESFQCEPFKQTASESGGSPHRQQEAEAEATRARWDSTDDRSERGRLKKLRTFPKVYGAWLLFFVSARTNKRHHHHREEDQERHWLLLNEVQGTLEGGRGGGGDEGSLLGKRTPSLLSAGWF